MFRLSFAASLPVCFSSSGLSLHLFTAFRLSELALDSAVFGADRTYFVVVFFALFHLFVHELGFCGGSSFLIAF